MVAATLLRRPLKFETPGAAGLPDSDGWMPGFAWIDTHDSATWVCHHFSVWPGHTTLYVIRGTDEDMGGPYEHLYVGVTGDIFRRFTQHRATKDWWRFSYRALLQCMVNREAALDAELEHIRVIDPPFNTIGRMR